MSFEKLSRPRVWYKYYSIYQEVSKVTNVGFSGLLYRNFWGVVTFGGLLLSGVVTFGVLLLSGGRYRTYLHLTKPAKSQLSSIMSILTCLMSFKWIVSLDKTKLYGSILS